MTISLKPLHEQVIVITGASSGIGLATARAAAKENARVVLASRNKEELARLEQEIKAEGGQAIHVVADVGSREDIEKIAGAAIKEFGGFDTWVNNAAVTMYGKLEDISEEDNHRLFDTNFWGVVSGSLVAAKYLKSRGGAIINIGSVLSDVSVPLQGIYSASKHAVKGFTDALRIELREENAPVSVTLIKPSGINTPYPEHAKNYTDKETSLPPPVYEPEEVAKAILYAATHSKRDIFVGSGAKVMSTVNQIAPAVMDWVGEHLMPGLQLNDRPARRRESSLHSPGSGERVHGDYEGHVMKSFYTRAATNPLITGAVVAAGAAAILLMKKR